MKRLLATTAALTAFAVAAPAWGQATTQDLMAMPIGQLRGEIQRRYDAGLAMSNDAAIIAADDARFVWASEAKVQCGIALGFLKSSTRDATSIGKCVLAADMMKRLPVPLPVPAPTTPVAAVPAQVCNQQTPGTVFFEFDSTSLPADAQQTIQFVSQNAAACGWQSFAVTGHTDRAGSNAYNQNLSQRRADAVVQAMAAMGIAAGAITSTARGEEQPRVPTEDGVRNPQNRRVEISVK